MDFHGEAVAALEDVRVLHRQSLQRGVADSGIGGRGWGDDPGGEVEARDLLAV